MSNESASEPSATNLPKAYDPSAIEQRWAEYWVRERLFDIPTPAPGDPPTPNFTMLLPPPNVTGYLHMGHMFEHTESDILMRWRRMCGDRAVWVPGTDHAGIATQMLVERQLTAEGTDRKALGREAFTARVWEWKRQYGSAITDQMRRLGASVDWSREYFTMDDRLSRAVKEAFVRLYEQGLIYRGAYIVNWDPVQQTAVSDLEVTHEERLGKLYHIRYPFADGTGSIVIATTRPETMLGDVAVAVNPDDARYQEYIGKLLTLPLSAAAGRPDREVPVLADSWANPEFGTGAVKVTPAHDANDFAIGQRHHLPSLTILDETARVTLPGSPYHGLDRFAARELIVRDLEAAGLLVAVKDHTLAIALSQRTRAVIEPRLSLQWFLAVNKPVPTELSSRPESERSADAAERPATPAPPRPSIAQTAIDAVRQGHIKFTPEMYEKTYMEWMTNIHDWCISRQLWWGHRIPAWHCTACAAITVARDTPAACATCHSTNITQETDVLDTWFSSGLLPFTVFGWPGEAATSAEAEVKLNQPHRGYAHVKLQVTLDDSEQGYRFTNDVQRTKLRTNAELADGEDPEAFSKWLRPGILETYVREVDRAIQEEIRAATPGENRLVHLKVSLIGGSYHEIESNPMAFRIAAGQAFREAYAKAILKPASNLTPDLAAFYPTSQLVTGFDILFFWVARMIMLGCHFMLDVPIPDGSPRTLAEAVPFRHVYIHALVRDANREKMSKTKGNVVDPIEIIQRFGTDAVRFTLASMASPGTDIAFNEDRTEGYRAFANKIWNAARFLFMNLDRAREAGIDFQLPTTANPGAPGLDSETWDLTPQTPLETRWILTRVSQTAAAVNASLADYRFDEAANHIYQFFWGDLCDWYLEIVKLRLNFESPSTSIPPNEAVILSERSESKDPRLSETLEATSAALTTLVAVFDAALRLLSPFMPFLTEEIWHALYAGNPPAKSIALTRYPQPSDYPADDEPIKSMETLQELITEVRAGRKEAGVPERDAVPILLYSSQQFIENPSDRFRLAVDAITENVAMLQRLARVSSIKWSKDELTGAGIRPLGQYNVQVVYERNVDIPAERERLTRDLAKHEKGLAAAERQLANESFVAKAPAHIVEGLRKQAAETRALYDKTKAALDALGCAGIGNHP